MQGIGRDGDMQTPPWKQAFMKRPAHRSSEIGTSRWALASFAVPTATAQILEEHVEIVRREIGEEVLNLGGTLRVRLVILTHTVGRQVSPREGVRPHGAAEVRDAHGGSIVGEVLQLADGFAQMRARVVEDSSLDLGVLRVARFAVARFHPQSRSQHVRSMQRALAALVC